jgi:hypothetical protein
MKNVWFNATIKKHAVKIVLANYYKYKYKSGLHFNKYFCANIALQYIY